MLAERAEAEGEVGQDEPVERSDSLGAKLAEAGRPSLSLMSPQINRITMPLHTVGSLAYNTENWNETYQPVHQYYLSFSRSWQSG